MATAKQRAAQKPDVELVLSHQEAANLLAILFHVALPDGDDIYAALAAAGITLTDASLRPVEYDVGIGVLVFRALDE